LRLEAQMDCKTLLHLKQSFACHLASQVHGERIVPMLDMPAAFEKTPHVKQSIVTLDMEGVLTPEIWIAVAEKTGIPECAAPPATSRIMTSSCAAASPSWTNTA